MTSKDNLNPLGNQRYFTVEQLCRIVDINAEQFEAWQREHGLVGYGGKFYNRLDVVKMLQLKASFEPYVDAFTRNELAEDGEPAMNAQQVKAHLAQLLSRVQIVIDTY